MCNPGMEPDPLHWEPGIFATGPPENSLYRIFLGETVPGPWTFHSGLLYCLKVRSDSLFSDETLSQSCTHKGLSLPREGGHLLEELIRREVAFSGSSVALGVGGVFQYRLHG